MSRVISFTDPADFAAARDAFFAARDEGHAPWAAEPPFIHGYRMLGPLGAGGMGMVFHAEHLESLREAAVKILAPTFVSPALLDRFQLEARTLEALRHPGIAAFREAGSYKSPLGPRPFLAMEFVDGLDLLEFARHHNPDTRHRLELLLRLAEAVGHAHRQGVVHRDLKPSNILVDFRGRPRVLDFGIAQALQLEAERTGLTRPGQILGTWRYLSPEQARGAATGPTADVHALGVLGWELIAGRPPFPIPEDPAGAVAAITTATPTALRVHRPDVPRHLEPVLHKALEKDPGRRYPDAAALAEDLANVHHGRPISISVPGRIRGALKRTASPHVRRVALGALAVVVIAGLVWALPGLRSPAGPRGTVESVSQKALEATRLIHTGPRSDESVREAVDLLTAALGEIGDVEPEPYLAHLRRFLYWRLGEAHYFLGTRHHDRNAIERAAGAWEIAREMRVGELPDGAWDGPPSLERHVLEISDTHPISAAAMAYAELAEYVAPRANQMHALWRRRVASEIFASHYPAAPGFLSLAIRDRNYGTLLNEYGDSHADLGRLDGDPELVRKGLRYFAVADSLDLLTTIDAPYASLTHNHGEAWLTLAELESDPDAALRAVAWFDSALTVRTATYEPRYANETRVGKARAHLLLARLAPDGKTRDSHLESAATWLAAARSVLRPGESAVEAARTDMAEAELDLLRARLLVDATALERADSLLVAAGGVLDARRFPVPHAELLVQGAEVVATARSLGRPVDVGAAHRMLFEAGEIVSDRDYASLHHRMATIRSRLE